VLETADVGVGAMTTFGVALSEAPVVILHVLLKFEAAKEFPTMSFTTPAVEVVT
jgi:hypothetical protein